MFSCIFASEIVPISQLNKFIMKYFKVYGDDLCVKLSEKSSTNVIICSEFAFSKLLDKVPVGSSLSIECIVDTRSCDDELDNVEFY